MAEKTVYEQLAASVGQGNSKIVPHIFKKLADEKEAAVVLAASPPRTVVQLAEETGFEESEVERMIDPLFKKGLMFKSKKSDATRYYRVRSFLQFHDSTAVMNDPPEGVMDLWKEWTAGEWIEASLSMDDHMPGPAMRVIPVNVAIDYNSQVLAMDDIADQIEQATTIAVTRCSCRVIDGACDLPLWNCVQLDKAADYALEVKASLRAAGFHVDADLRDLKMQKKVREAQISYYNYILVCGEKEKEARTVNVRTRDNKVHGEHQLTSLVEVLAKEKSSRSLESLFESELAGELEKKLTVE